MTDLYYNIPSQIIFGADSLMRAGSLLAGISRRALIVADGILHENNIIEKLKELLAEKQVNAIIFDEVIPNSTSSTIEDGLKLARAAHVDSIIGLGGVRTLSAAKCIAMAYEEKKSIDDFLMGAIPQANPRAYFEIPTTCRNQFAFRDECLIVDARDRSGRIVRTQPGITKLVLADPMLASSLSGKFTAASILDTLLTAIESYISAKSNFISDVFARRAIELIQSLLPEGLLKTDDMETRETASMAGLLAAMSLSSSAPGVGIGLSFALGSRFLIPKSMISTILLPYILEFNRSTSPNKIADIAQMLGEDTEGLEAEDASKLAEEAGRRIITFAKIPARLRDLDLRLDDLLPVSEMIYTYELSASLPKRPSVNELYDIVKAAF
jgi:alcohol dehydrogenase